MSKYTTRLERFILSTGVTLVMTSIGMFMSGRY